MQTVILQEPVDKHALVPVNSGARSPEEDLHRCGDAVAPLLDSAEDVRAGARHRRAKVGLRRRLGVVHPASRSGGHRTRLAIQEISSFRQILLIAWQTIYQSISICVVALRV
eukprot:2969644-Pleurochrysis_carterae.AAC.16